MDNVATTVYLDVEGDVTNKTFRPARRRLVWLNIGRWLTIIDVILVLALVWRWVEEGITTAVAVTAEFAFAGLFLLVIFVVGVPRMRRNKAFNEGHMHFVANDDGLQVEGSFGTQAIRWDMYKKAYADSGFIYMFLTNRLAQLIPRELVPDPDPLLKHLARLGLLRPAPRLFFLF
jgi:YcxB-like protein